MKRSEPEQQPYHSLTMLCLPHSLLRQRSGRWKRVILHRSPLRTLPESDAGRRARVTLRKVPLVHRFARITCLLRGGGPDELREALSDEEDPAV